MDAKVLKEITSELNLLYVEDDDDLRVETLKLFSHLFKTIHSAENGKVALEALEQGDYDLIITDINMPVMDGITLSKNIKKSYPTQSIIITSAHDEASYLLELIDIGIDKFILKPLNMHKLLSALSEVCTHIQNKKLIKRYKLEIETSNKSLTKKNEELQSLVKILDTKIIQLNHNTIDKVPPKSLSNPSSTINIHPPQVQGSLMQGSKELYVYTKYMKKDDIQSLTSLETQIDAISELLTLENDISLELVQSLVKSIYEYSQILHHYTIFKKLSLEMHNLAHAIEKSPTSFIENISNVFILLKSFIYVLKKWNVSLFHTGIKDPNIYDVSMMNDMKTMIMLMQGNEEKPL